MINISMLNNASIGKWVLYSDGVGNEERGKIKSWNDSTIFVVFRCDGRWNYFKDYTGEGCSPKDLRFESKSDIRDNCVEHHYLPWGIYESGRRCQFCGDEIGTNFNA